MGRLRHVAAGAGGGIAFLVFYLGLGAGAGASLLLAGAAYAGLLLLGRALTPAVLPDDGIAAALVEGAGERLRRLDELAAGLGPGLHRRFQAIAAAALDTVALIERRPAEAMAHRRPLTFWLDMALRIAEQAVELQALAGPDHPDLAKIAGMLDEVGKAFADHADSALGRLDLELAVIARTIEAERGKRRPRERE
ncbi:hypothetical protein [Zavarzinia compransoris]|uniref:5-bromo-4-chloroindolyl phosphate hydrolase n=1 Tax=Zavarzinia compransoris TaxID=1264899 RepID=A0A317EAK7_9PROT|nr:hypothetical protein [Zavarzinia compransoris]PWR23989.1 hypothetical protein DKG75_05455 [Zavarzinia compransoris]TDP48247.1 hypothetical protein DES42_102550 [Zavarzinia compransoris]